MQRDTSCNPSTNMGYIPNDFVRRTAVFMAMTILVTAIFMNTQSFVSQADNVSDLKKVLSRNSKRFRIRKVKKNSFSRE